MIPATALKIFTAEQWVQFQSDGIFLGAPVDLTDGYIHMSTDEQVNETLSKYFSAQSGIVIARIDLTTLGSAVRWEVSRGGALFPHLYAPLPMAAVLSIDERP